MITGNIASTGSILSGGDLTVGAANNIFITSTSGNVSVLAANGGGGNITLDTITGSIDIGAGDGTTAVGNLASGPVEQLLRGGWKVANSVEITSNVIDTPGSGFSIGTTATLLSIGPGAGFVQTLNFGGSTVFDIGNNGSFAVNLGAGSTAGLNVAGVALLNLGPSSFTLAGDTDSTISVASSSLAISAGNTMSILGGTGGSPSTLVMDQTGATLSAPLGSTLVINGTSTTAIHGASGLALDSANAGVTITADASGSFVANGLTLNGGGGSLLLQTQSATRIAVDSGGNITIGEPTVNVGFFGSGGAVISTVAALTNSVTSGGTSDVIANYTSLVVYATDAAAIRNNIYQLARKVSQLEVALNSYNLTKH